MDEKISSIASFFEGRSVLVTGATGFVGKVVIEKLLRSCPGISTIYVLLRPKRGLEPQQRLEKLLKLELFERVKREQPNAISKVFAIPGDMLSDALGLSPSDEKLITENVSVVIHSAATIALNDPLKPTFDMNVLGTYRLVQLCRKMQELKAFVHVSTAYINFGVDVVEEVVYLPSISPQKLIDTFEWLDDDMANALSPYLLEGTPTYTYTKSLAEAYLSECKDLPVAIVRPSMINSTWKEPFPSWVDRYNIITGVAVTTIKGILRCFYCDVSHIVDLIPVDVVANLIIAAAWHVGSHRPESIMVYNCTSGSINGLTYQKLKDIFLPLTYKYPSEDLFRSPSVITVNNDISYYIFTTMFHTIPAYFYDFLFILAGRETKLVRLYEKFHKAMDSAKPYIVLHKWNFAHKNAIVLQEMLSPEDAKEFYFNIESLSWTSYLEDMIVGGRQFLLKEDPSTLPVARKKLKRLILFEKVTKYIFITIILFLCVKIFFPGI